MSEYMTDEELLQFINDVEMHDIVDAPPGLTDAVIDKINKKDKLIEYKRFRNRVIAAVAAILIITISAPNSIAYISKGMEKLSYGDSFMRQSYYISDLLNRKED